MLPGPIRTFECPNCKSLTYKRSIASGNTIGAKLYSDGKRIAPMLPIFPIITKCQKCNNIYWLENENQRLNVNLPENIKEANFLSTDEYLSVIGTDVIRNKADEKYIRREIWWTFNDNIRDQENPRENLASNSEYCENAKSLIGLLDENIQDFIMKAELYRNIGEFWESIVCLNQIESNDLDFIIDSVLKMSIIGHTNTFRLY